MSKVNSKNVAKDRQKYVNMLKYVKSNKKYRIVCLKVH